VNTRAKSADAADGEIVPSIPDTARITASRGGGRRVDFIVEVPLTISDLLSCEFSTPVRLGRPNVDLIEFYFGTHYQFYLRTLSIHVIQAS
jgi:hypothetical protein